VPFLIHWRASPFREEDLCAKEEKLTELNAQLDMLVAQQRKEVVAKKERCEQPAAPSLFVCLRPAASLAGVCRAPGPPHTRVPVREIMMQRTSSGGGGEDDDLRLSLGLSGVEGLAAEYQHADQATLWSKSHKLGRRGGGARAGRRVHGTGMDEVLEAFKQAREKVAWRESVDPGGRHRKIMAAAHAALEVGGGGRSGRRPRGNARHAGAFNNLVAPSEAALHGMVDIALVHQTLSSRRRQLGRRAP
jgi:hypothetical protein